MGHLQGSGKGLILPTCLVISPTLGVLNNAEYKLPGTLYSEERTAAFYAVKCS